MATSKRPEMEHKVGAVNQSARDNPLTGSALKALVRGWMAGTAGLPGDLEGLARMGINKAFSHPGNERPVDEAPALPTSAFYKEWLPGKQVGDENVTEVGSLFGGVGATKPIALGKGALSRVAQAAPGPLAGSRAAMKGVIKAPGGNWLSGSVEDALKGLKRNVPLTADEMRRAGSYESEIERALANPPPVDQLNQFIDKQLTRYVKNDMATERDPIRALAEQGVLHYEPRMQTNLALRRRYAGFSEEGFGKSDLAKAYEGSTDRAVGQGKASGYLSDYSIDGSGVAEKRIVDNPWLSKVPPETRVYSPDGSTDLKRLAGFDHLIDELRNATNPQSGLPAHLLLDPASLDRVSVPDAVKRVAAINEWRAAQKAEANSAIANNAATVPFKEYAENNPKGLKWVELKQGKLPEDWAEEFVDTGLGKLRKFRDPKTGGLTATDPTEEALRAALKYEGDAMGHCVGGYCDDVASGKSRIFSLRDAKGQPHVTIEQRPGVKAPKGFGPWEQVPESVRLDMTARGLAPTPKMIRDGMVYGQDGKAAFTSEPQILQIKGKGNKKPNDEYLPFVQDFVKSGKWSDVGDLQNSGLRKTSDAWNANELKKIQDSGIQVPSHATQAEIDAIGEQVWPGQWGQSQKPGFADGGAVQHFDAGGEVAGPGYTARGDDFTPYDPLMEAHKERVIKEQAAHTARNTMSREDFLKKYGQTFVADDKGGNAASEVAGQDVGQYYDRYLAPGAIGMQSVSTGWDGDAGTVQAPISWGEGKYTDAHPYFDGWDNVNPHPKSQKGNGWDEAWKQVGRPVATAVAAYYGLGALAGMGGAGAAAGAGTAGSAGIGSGTVLGGGAATGTASGVAGMMGMAPGYGATALNTGALNTGVGLARGQNIGDAVRGGVTAAALSPVGTWVGDSVGGGAIGTIAGRTAVGGLQGLATGRGLSDGLQQGLTSGVLDVAGDYIGGQVAGSTGSKFAGTAANSLTKSTLRGLPPDATLDSLATQYAAGEISDLSGLDPKLATVVVNLARNKKVSPVGALTALASSADRAVGSKKLARTAVGG